MQFKPLRGLFLRRLDDIRKTNYVNKKTNKVSEKKSSRRRRRKKTIKQIVVENGKIYFLSLMGLLTKVLLIKSQMRMIEQKKFFLKKRNKGHKYFTWEIERERSCKRKD